MAKINNMQRQLNNHYKVHSQIMRNLAAAEDAVSNIEKQIRQIKGEPEPKPLTYADRFY